MKIKNLELLKKNNLNFYFCLVIFTLAIFENSPKLILHKINKIKQCDFNTMGCKCVSYSHPKQQKTTKKKENLLFTIDQIPASKEDIKTLYTYEKTIGNFIFS